MCWIMLTNGPILVVMTKEILCCIDFMEISSLFRATKRWLLLNSAIMLQLNNIFYWRFASFIFQDTRFEIDYKNVGEVKKNVGSIKMLDVQFCWEYKIVGSPKIVWKYENVGSTEMWGQNCWESKNCWEYKNCWTYKNVGEVNIVGSPKMLGVQKCWEFKIVGRYPKMLGIQKCWV